MAAFLMSGGISPAEAAKRSDRKTTDCSPVASGGLSAVQGKCFKYAKATLKITKNRRGKVVDEKAIPPDSAPPAIKRVIRRANRIRNEPYFYSGGRGPKWYKKIDPRGYDCSGAVSFALRGLGRDPETGKVILPSPLASGDLESWGRKGPGKWISVHTDSGHAYMVVAGLRFDTSMTRGRGPGWSTSLKSTPSVDGGYTVRSWPGF